MSPKVGKYLWKNNLIKLKLFLPEKIFWAYRTKVLQSCKIFRKSFFFPKPESKKKYKKLPRKLSNSTKSLRTRRLIFDNTAKNFSKFSQKKIRIKVRKKFNKIAFMKTVVFAQIISACVTCTFESPAKLCLQRSNKIQIRLRNQF